MQAAVVMSVLAIPGNPICANWVMSSLASRPLWSLHPQLERDTAPVGDLALSRLLLMNDANYPWVILVPRRPGAVELVDLDEPDRTRLLAEIVQVSDALKNLTACDKLNVAAIGNVVPQLHVHVVARRKDDAAWPRPVWGAVPARPYAAVALQSFVVTLRGATGIA
jgi:diadenosine tetraphosphate (Ap4A) HIT family hydrolase